MKRGRKLIRGLQPISQRYLTWDRVVQKEECFVYAKKRFSVRYPYGYDSWLCN